MAIIGPHPLHPHNPSTLRLPCTWRIAHRISAAEANLGAVRLHVLASEFRRAGALQRILLRYTQSLIAQMSQTAVCNRLHSVEQQLCRWLLLSHDRLPSNELIMTQELIADMLGVRREAVSQQAARLQDAGLISYHRGVLPSSTERVSKREYVSATAWSVVKRTAS